MKKVYSIYETKEIITWMYRDSERREVTPIVLEHKTDCDTEEEALELVENWVKYGKQFDRYSIIPSYVKA